MQDLNDHRPRAARLIGRKLVNYDKDSGVAVVEYEGKPEFTNRHGTIQGGFLTAMLDSAAGIALVAGLPEGATVVTRRLDSTYLKPAAVGVLVATARVQKVSGRDVEVLAELSNSDGVVVARATAYLRTSKASSD